MRIFYVTLSTVLLGILIGGVCYLAGGISLDFFLAGLFFAAIVIPPISLAHNSTSNSLADGVGFTSGVAAVWLCAVANRNISFEQWLACVAILASFIFAIARISRLLASLRVTPILAAALMTITSLLWLTWPIWASAFIAGRSINWPVLFHPIFAMNSACTNLGNWTEQRIAYHLTNLGQDAIYKLPTSIFPCIIAQALSGVVASATMWAVEKLRSKSQ